MHWRTTRERQHPDIYRRLPVRRLAAAGLALAALAGCNTPEADGSPAAAQPSVQASQSVGVAAPAPATQPATQPTTQPEASQPAMAPLTDPPIAAEVPPSSDTAPPLTDTPPPKKLQKAPSGQSGIGRIGADSYTFDNALQVAVLSATPHTFSRYAGMKPGKVGIKVKVRLTNGGPKPFEASGVDIIVTSGSDGNQTTKIYDGSGDTSIGFRGSVAPGRNLTTEVGFAVNKADLPLITVEIRPSYSGQGATFEGKVGRPAAPRTGGSGTRT